MLTGEFESGGRCAQGFAFVLEAILGKGKGRTRLLRFEMGLGATSSEAERLEVKVVVIRELLPSYLAYIQ